jgi:glutamate--cysteine ligase
VRLKRFLEMRGADAGPWKSLCALPALWVGLLYDGDALGAAWDLVKDWTPEEHTRLRAEVPRQGLATAFRGATVMELADDVLEIARAGLARRGRLDWIGRDEGHFLAPLQETLASGVTPAEHALEAFHGRWKGSVDPAFKEYAY